MRGKVYLNPTGKRIYFGFNSVQKRSRIFRYVNLLFVLLVILSVIFSIPFFLVNHFSWSEMNPYLQGIVFSLTTALFCHAWLSLRVVNTFFLFIITFLISYPAEITGIHFEWPFSSLYTYNTAIIPRLPGDVPVCIPLVWFMLSYTALIFYSHIQIRKSGRKAIGKVILKSIFCGFYIMAADFVIDPLAVMYNSWSWDKQGSFFGVPSGNFIGWFLVGFTICFISLIIERPSYENSPKRILSSDLKFMVISIMLTTLCFAGCILRIKSIIPLVLTLIGMCPAWIYQVKSMHKSLIYIKNTSKQNL